MKITKILYYKYNDYRDTYQDGKDTILLCAENTIEVLNLPQSKSRIKITLSTQPFVGGKRFFFYRNHYGNFVLKTQKSNSKSLSFSFVGKMQNWFVKNLPYQSIYSYKRVYIGAE